ncbi:MAG: hypothetical protein WCF26_06320, partial [Candidatus Sulfotelmatobacter sp.]
MSSCFSRCLRVPIAIRAFYESYLWILQALLLTHPDLHPGLLGLNLRLTYNSARSGFRPDINPADAARLGNQYLIQQGTFDPSGLFPSALGNVNTISTQISEVIVPQWIGQSKAYYIFPRKFEGGLLFYYGSYRDYWNPNLNGTLRTFNVYVGRSW